MCEWVLKTIEGQEERELERVATELRASLLHAKACHAIADMVDHAIVAAKDGSVTPGVSELTKQMAVQVTHILTSMPVTLTEVTPAGIAELIRVLYGR